MGSRGLLRSGACADGRIGNVSLGDRSGGTGVTRSSPTTHELTSEELTIDELARRAGVVVSTVRLYQNKGLVPPPRRRGRVGYYGIRHLDRLRAIAGLQERGFSLAGIKELFDGLESGESLGAVVGLGLQSSMWSP